MLDFNDQPPYAWADDSGAPAATGKIRSSNDDFAVTEELGFDPDGDGPHLLVSVTKQGRNTVDAAGWLSQVTGAPVRDIGYCGLKDRHAVTTQWFSIPGHGIALSALETAQTSDYQVNSVAAHRRKLRRGVHRANRFTLVVRDLTGDSDALLARLARTRSHGVPNYFGPQRFGPDGDNVRAGMQMLLSGRSPKRRNTRGILLSALRSTLFNQVLSNRVVNATWETLIPGDVAMLDGSRSHFNVDVVDDTLRERLRTGDIHPTGPLPGAGRSPVSGDVAEIEEHILANSQVMERALEAAGLRHERRALRVMPRGLEWRLRDDGTLELEFALPRGSYATAVLRELVCLPDDVAPWGETPRPSRRSLRPV